MSFICKAEHSGIVSHLYDGAQIAADTVISRIVDKYCNCIGMLSNSLSYVFTAHAERDTKAAVNIRINIYRNSAAEYQRVDDASVDVSGQDDLVTLLAAGKHHALNGARRASYHEESMLCAKCISCQKLSLTDDRYRMAEVIQRLHAVDVNADTLLAKKCCEFGIALAVLMSGHVERNDPHLAESFESFIDRSSGLIQFCFFHTPPQTKSASCNYTTCA